jgi:TonB family protein
MSYQPLWLRDLVAYSIQAAAMVGVGVVMARVLRLRMPRVRHAYWQALLAVCVFLPFLQPWRPEMLEPSGAVLSEITLAAPPTAAAPTGPSLAQIVLWLICAGIVLRLAWMALGLGRLWLYRRHAERINQTPEAVREAQRLVPASSSFFISRQIPIPATFGFFQPAILFPARFLDMEPAMQKAIALHELLHVERRDWLWNMFEEIVLTLLWFHLPLWWVVRSARLSREQVVDAEAVRRSNARRPYLKALLEMAGQKRLAESLPAPLFLRESQLAERVALMMKEVHMSRTRLTVSILTAVVTLLISGATLVWAFPLKTAAPQAGTPEASSSAAGSEGALSANPSLSGNSVAAEAQSGDEKTKASKGGGNGEIEPVKPVYKEQPKYPQQAKAKHLSGKVILSCVVDAKGNVTKVTEVSKPLGGGLDESAMDAVRNWKYKPATLDGVPVEVKTDVTINFTLKEKPGKGSPKSSPTTDPPAQNNQSSSTSSNVGHSAYIDQEEIRRQLDEAMQQAKIAQEVASKIDQKKIQEQIDQALRQAKIAQKNFAKIDQGKIQQQVKEAMKQVEKLQTPEMRRQMQEQMEQLKKMNTPEMRQQLMQAMAQAKIAQESAARMDRCEVQRELEQARKQVQQAKREVQAAREETKKAREDAIKARREAEAQGKAGKPALSVAPKPSPVPPKEVSPPPPPPPPPPPKTPESAAVVGGVTGGVVGGVPGGKIDGVQGGQVIGVPGEIAGGVITAPHPPVAPSLKEAAPPPVLASPTPPPTPQN